MSVHSLEKIQEANQRALNRPDYEWETSDTGNYPNGKHPWLNIYTNETVQEIGSVIRIKDEQKLRELRLLLADACAEYYFTIRVCGGLATSAKKRDWRRNVISLIKRLLLKLVDSYDYHDSFTTLKIGKNDSDAISTSTTSHLADEAIQALERLQLRLEEIDHVVSPKDKIRKNADLETRHMSYLQFAVDKFTYVYVHFCGIEAVRRTIDESGVRGEFPDFIRAAAEPTLVNFNSRFSKDPETYRKLDRQTQKAASWALEISRNSSDLGNQSN